MTTINGTFGASKTECEIIVYDDWYVVFGSTNINQANDIALLVDGVDVESIEGRDTMQAKRGVETIEHLEAELDEDWEYFFNNTTTVETIDEDSHDIESMHTDFDNGNLDQGGDYSPYTWINRATKKFENGDKDGACDICSEYEINPVDINIELARFFIDNGYTI